MTVTILGYSSVCLDYGDWKRSIHWGRFFDVKKNILTESQFDDLYDTAIDSQWITKKISTLLEDLKKLITMETSNYLKENNWDYVKNL